MRRISIAPRPDWKQRVEQLGLIYHSGPESAVYWDESAYYEFTPAEIETLETAGKELHQMFLRACGNVIENRRFDELGIPQPLHDLIVKSWHGQEWEVYGRFDLAFDGGCPKLLEYNADTPTSLLEASLVQWAWKEKIFPQSDQFNSIHEELVLRWKDLQTQNGAPACFHPLYLTSLADHPEDRMTLGYLGETAEQAGYQTRFIEIDQIGWNAKRGEFVDLPDQPIRMILKLYPWEWLAMEPFGQYLAYSPWRVIEPPWKAVLASKALLLILQELYPQHEYLLSVGKKPLHGNYVKKPFFGREGRFVSLHGEGSADLANPSVQTLGYIYQSYQELYRFGLNYAQVGVWMVGSEACGMGVREDIIPILTDRSRFIPHIVS